MSPGIEVRDLRKSFRAGWSYRKVSALDGLSLTVPRGSRFGLLGPGGSGKSTFARIVLGELCADSGSVLVSARTIGYLPQNAPAGSLPAAIAGEPELIILDEPAPELREFLLPRVPAHSTILAMSRHVGVIEQLCSDVAILAAGKLTALYHPREEHPHRGFRISVSSLPDHICEELVRTGFTVGLNRMAHWVESQDTDQLSLLIDRLRAAGIAIENIETTASKLERLYRIAQTEGSPFEDR